MTEKEEKSGSKDSEDENSTSTKQGIMDSTIIYIHCKVEGCNKRYTKNKNMLAHIRSVHDKFSQKFYCPVESCGQYFNYKHVLDRHMKNNNHKQICKDPEDDPDYSKKQWKKLFGSLVCFEANEKSLLRTPEAVEDGDNKRIKRAKI